jgi:hypothetical protein
MFILLGFGYLVSRPRKELAGDMDAPVNVERGHARTFAEMSAAGSTPMSTEDEEEVAAFDALATAIRTDEHPFVYKVHRVRHRRPLGPRLAAAERNRRREQAALEARTAAFDAFSADPLGAEIPATHDVAVPVEFTCAALRLLAPRAIESARAPFPELPAEPDALPPLDFTGSWNGSARRELRELFAAEAKAKASR